jgi:hypothetical protein
MKATTRAHKMSKQITVKSVMAFNLLEAKCFRNLFIKVTSIPPARPSTSRKVGATLPTTGGSLFEFVKR